MITVTEARVEVYHEKRWKLCALTALGFDYGGQYTPPMPDGMSTPEAIVHGRAARRFEHQRGDFGGEPAGAVRVIDSSGAIVAQWGTP